MNQGRKETRIKNYPHYLNYQIESFEKMPIDLFENAADGSIYIAEHIAFAIRDKQEKGENIVLGLATGSSPLKVYSELIRMHREEGLSFRNVITFNLDEYYPINPDQIESYHWFMNEYLFDHIDIPKENINIPSGTVPISEIEIYCTNYETKIEECGGIDIQLLGIGRTGHIGFNEPGSDDKTLTRLVRLDNLTRRDASDDFGGIEKVPYEAITMGVKTILGARQIFIMAWGQHKAEVVKSAIEGVITSHIPSTFLQDHPNVRFMLDKAAASRLTKVQTPWKAGACHWDDDLACKAVTWLSQKINKPILKLTDEDYNEHGLSELLLKRASAYQLNIQIFNRLQQTITGWPGGKPNTDDSQRPERAAPARKRILIFSPHPDDDVISMGGTFLRLVEQDHEVYVAYQTSGNIAVHDHEALRYLEFFEDYSKIMELELSDNESLDRVKDILSEKAINKNTAEVRQIKGLIRRGEARAAARFCGLDDAHIIYMDMPFYETGSIKKKALSDEDIQMTMDLIDKIKPHQVFAAGDLADPHGTHRVCLNAVLSALRKLKDREWIHDCWLWLYRGAWEEFEVHEIEMAVPLSPAELLKKRQAIFIHQSQKDKPPFPGDDNREFWQRTEDRNRNTANMYRALGFAEYEAMEAFKRWIY